MSACMTSYAYSNSKPNLDSSLKNFTFFKDKILSYQQNLCAKYQSKVNLIQNQIQQLQNECSKLRIHNQRVHQQKYKQDEKIMSQQATIRFMQKQSQEMQRQLQKKQQNIERIKKQTVDSKQIIRRMKQTLLEQRRNIASNRAFIIQKQKEKEKQIQKQIIVGKRDNNSLQKEERVKKNNSLHINYSTNNNKQSLNRDRDNSLVRNEQIKNRSTFKIRSVSTTNTKTNLKQRVQKVHQFHIKNNEIDQLSDLLLLVFKNAKRVKQQDERRGNSNLKRQSIKDSFDNFNNAGKTNTSTRKLTLNPLIDQNRPSPQQQSSKQIVQLISTVQTQDLIKMIQQQKQLFRNLPINQLINIILDSNKVQQVIRLLKNQKLNNIKNYKQFIHQIRKPITKAPLTL